MKENESTARPEWKRTDKWKPASQGGGGSGFSVENPLTGELGHAKPVQVAAEVLASYLAKAVQVAVPTIELGQVEGKTHAVSKLWGARSMDVPQMKRDYPDDYRSDSFQSALRAASALLPYHAWIGTGDLKDDHLVVRSPGVGQFEIGHIDFQSAFNLPTDGGTIDVPAGPPDLIAHRDVNVLDAAVTRIEALSDDEIKRIVHGLPDDVLSQADKERVYKGLIARKKLLRAAFEKQGWLSQQPKGETHGTQIKANNSLGEG